MRHFAPWPLLFVFGGAVGILSAQAPPATAVTELTATRNRCAPSRLGQPCERDVTDRGTRSGSGRYFAHDQLRPPQLIRFSFTNRMIAPVTLGRLCF
jgi:hypothetical protein